ncbi:hypothetical protein LTR48_008874 [Friedmanniomyces endolithicus]|nr:hypothetical protein LTR48_008874 [Friedmanniomyces endolithicus]
MLFDPDAEFVRQVTGGDVALAEKVKKGEGLGGESYDLHVTAMRDAGGGHVTPGGLASDAS